MGYIRQQENSLFLDIMCYKTQKNGQEKKIWVTLTSANKWWLDNWVIASQKHQVLWGIPGMQWLVPTTNGTRKDNRWTGFCSLPVAEHRHQPQWKSGKSELQFAVYETAQPQTGQWWPWKHLLWTHEHQNKTVWEGRMDEGCLVWWIPFSFIIRWMLDECASFTWGRDGRRMTIVRRQVCTGSVMLWPMFCWET